MSRREELIKQAQCPCYECRENNSNWGVSESLIEQIIKLEQKIGKKVTVSSGVRCEDYNREIGGYWDSPHLPKPICYAFDIQVKGMTNIELAKNCEQLEFKRIGIYPNHIHVDMVNPYPSKYWYLKKYGVTPEYSKSYKTLKEFLEYLKKKGGLSENDRVLFDRYFGNSVDSNSLPLQKKTGNC